MPFEQRVPQMDAHVAMIVAASTREVSRSHRANARRLQKILRCSLKQLGYSTRRLKLS
jgi:hypothetical protein